MATENIETLAKQEGPLSSNELEQRLLELKGKNWTTLECIIYVRHNQGCNLSDAVTLVLNSSAWIEQKDELEKQQEEEQNEFFEAMAEDVRTKYNRLYILPK